MSMTQRQGVYVAVMNFLADKGTAFDDGQTPTAAELITKDDRAKIVALIAGGFNTNEIAMTSEAAAKYCTPEGKTKYSGELLSNWLRKDERLNGGGKYQPKNPGSRTNSKDSMLVNLKNLRTLQEQSGNTEAIQAIDAAIAARQTELAIEKAPAIQIDASKIPTHLLHLVK